MYLMPKKLLLITTTPTSVLEKLCSWAQVIRAERVGQGMTAEALCTRVGVSRSSLRRVEQGDPTVGINVYLSALLILGQLEALCPSVVAPSVGQGRARPPKRDVLKDDNF
jgi:transcriptional regulator with XRE-family HTH domain